MNATERRMLAQLCADCRFDPLAWAEVAWPWGRPETKWADADIRRWQAVLFDDIAKHLSNPETRYMPGRFAVSSGHGIGKSAGFGMLSNWAMSCWPGARVVVTANTENQLRTKTSPEIAQWFRDAVSAPLFDVDTMAIKGRERDAEAWTLDFVPWSENNTEAFAGLHAQGRLVMLLMDEGSAIAEKVWEVAQGALTDENTILLWVVAGNPTRNTGAFRECFRRYRHLWKTYQIDSRTVEGTNKRYLQELVDAYGEDSDVVKVRIRGMFPSASSRQLIPTELVDAAFGRHLREEQYSFAPVVLSCDPAWTGDDDLVIGKRQGLRFDILDVIPKNDNDTYIASKLANYETQYGARAGFIDFGYGTGIFSALSTMGRANWRLVNFAEKATKPGFVNKRAEMWTDTGVWLREGGAIPKDQGLYEDLIGVETKPTPNGAVQLVSKEDMKKMGLPSPNKGDALALTFAYDVPTLADDLMVGHARATRARRRVYDPLTGEMVDA